MPPDDPAIHNVSPYAADPSLLPWTGLSDRRFWRKVNKGGPVPDYNLALGPCWIWMGTIVESGYGKFGKRGYAHRLAYRMLVGPIPDGLELDHLCRVRGCCNPSHLEPVTHRENIMRGRTITAREAAKTHCVNGHPFDEANTYWRKTPWGVGRQCRRCVADRVAPFNAQRARKVAA